MKHFSKKNIWLLKAKNFGYLYFPVPDPGPWLQFLFNGPGPNLYLQAPALNLHLPAPGPQFVFTGPSLL